MIAKEILDVMEAFAPSNTAEDWDNCGLQVGSETDEISRILLALDATGETLAQAEAGTLLLTHHPLLFTPISCLKRDSLPAKALQKGVTVASYHTSLDRADGGVNDCLAGVLNLQNPTTFSGSEGFGRMGSTPEASPEAFAEFTVSALDCAAPKVVLGNRPVSIVAVASGSGGCFLEAAASAGADAFVTGEAKHHEALLARELGITLIEAGHFESERVVLPKLKELLAGKFPKLPIIIANETSPYQR